MLGVYNCLINLFASIRNKYYFQITLFISKNNPYNCNPIFTG